MGETVQMTDFSSETMQARRKWHISQVLKENNCQHKALYPVKTSFWNGREIKTFSDERKLREYVTGILNLKRMAEGSSEKRKEMIKKKKKKRILGHQEGGKNNTKYKSVGKYNRLFFSFWVF